MGGVGLWYPMGLIGVSTNFLGLSDAGFWTSGPGTPELSHATFHVFIDSLSLAF